MQLRQLELFVAVAERGSFSRGAESALRTQSTVSQQIAALENEVGVRLFDRTGRGAELTAAGTLFLTQARRVLTELASLRATMEAFRGGRAISIALGASTIPATYLLPRLLKEIAARHPGLTLQLICADSSAIVERLVAGEFELAVVGDSFARSGCDFAPLGLDVLVLVVGVGHPWWSRACIDQSELMQMPLLLREGGSGSGRALEGALHAAGFDPAELTVAARLGSNEAIKEAVASGFGAAFLSQSSISREVARGELREVTVTGLEVKRRFWLARRSGRSLSPGAAALAALLQERYTAPV